MHGRIYLSDLFIDEFCQKNPPPIIPSIKNTTKKSTNERSEGIPGTVYSAEETSPRPMASSHVRRGCLQGAAQGHLLRGARVVGVGIHAGGAGGADAQRVNM